ncbi:MAG: SRPBCC family protein [Deltaproteobacteria bacterium]|nr:SRPBCC family protein [Deltaproteobacteria bacterium]
MSSAYPCVVVLVAVLATGSRSHADDRPISVTLTERPEHVTRGTVIVDAPPAEVYALVTDYANWPRILGDIRAVKVESGGSRDARVKLRSTALKYEATVQFDNEEGRAIRFHGIKGPPGGRARGAYVLTPLDGGTRTLVTADLYLDVVGAPGLFVSDKQTRGMRQAKLRADLGDVAGWFATHRRSQPSS